MGSRDFQIFLGLCVAALSAAVVWLAVKDRDHRSAQTAALQHRVDTLQRELTALQATARGLAAETAAQLKAQAAQIAQLRSQSPQLASRCLTEVQQEIDDIRSFIAFGGGIRRRVSPECATLLRPRFGG